MIRSLAIVVAIALSSSLVACGGEFDGSASGAGAFASEAADSLIGSTVAGKADARSTALTAELGGSYRFSLRERAPGAKIGPAQARVLRLGELPAGQTVAVVLRRVDGGALNAYLAVFAAGERVRGLGLQGVQGIAPMAAETDEVVVFTARGGVLYDVFASDGEFEATATVQVDVVALSRAPAVDANVTNPGVRTYARLLRELEGQLDADLLSGALVESEGGLVATDVSQVSLKERARLFGFSKRVNRYRAGLYEQLVRAAVEERDLGKQTAMGEFCAELWTALRVEGHRID